MFPKGYAESGVNFCAHQRAPDYNTADMTVDPSGMVAVENMQDSLNVWVNEYREQSIVNLRQMANKGDKLTVKACLDSSNDKMEWSESNGTVRYLKRKTNQ